MSVFTGKTVENAVQAGLKQLNLKRSAAKINVIQKGRHGFLGIGRRDAKVDVSRKPEPKSKPRRTPKSFGSSQASSSYRRPSSHRASNSESQPQTSFTIKQRKPAAVSNVHDHNNDNEMSRSQRNREAIKKLEGYLGRVIRLLGINATMKAEYKTRKRVKIDFKTDKEGLLIGKHGLTINALQALSEVYLNRLGIYHVYVELDTANYRQRRMDILGRLAEKTAREAVATGKPVYLDPMPSFERKKIHKTLEDSDHVMTYSAGREPYRAIVVAPK